MKKLPVHEKMWRSKAKRKRDRERRGTSAAEQRYNRSAARRQRKKRQIANRAFLDAIKSQPCADCGGTFDPVCMDFDHRPGEVKVLAISRMLSKSLSMIKAEIAKCDLVCANCHRIRTIRLRDHRASTMATGKASRLVAPESPQLTLAGVDA